MPNQRPPKFFSRAKLRWKNQSRDWLVNKVGYLCS